MILGDPGSGKTTHLKRTLLWCLEENRDNPGLAPDMLPVFLPLRELADRDQGLEAFIQSQLDDPLLGTPPGFGQRLLRRGRLLLLFDGLDEVADAAQRARVMGWIDTALKVNPTCRFVVTCRYAGYTDESRLSADFLEMHMRPLSEEQAADFVHKWYRAVESGQLQDADQDAQKADHKAGDLLKRLKAPEFRASRIFGMTRNPLLLTNLCLVHNDGGCCSPPPCGCTERKTEPGHRRPNCHP